MKENLSKKAIVSLILIFLVACATEDQAEEENEGTNLQTDRPTDEVEESNLPKEPETITNEISVSAIGDILVHQSVYNDAKTAGGYNFAPMFERVKPFLENATITMANQETMIGGIELGLSTYPRFNSPHEIGNTLRDVGVDVVTLANNHTLDRGEEAIQNALEHWETIDMMYAGSYKDAEDRKTMRVLHTDENIDVAFLSYTYGTNGLPIPEGKDFLVNLIDKEKIAKDIETAEEMSDAIILSLHFGAEYQRMPNEEQKDLVKLAADHGVDVVIGHHPHVLQPVDWVEGKNGHKTLVAYSLGNFLSGQDKLYRQIGGVLNFTIEKVTKGQEETVKVKSPKFLPTYVSYQNWRDFQIIPMYQLTDADLPNASGHYEEIKAHMSQWIPELEFSEKE